MRERSFNWGHRRRSKKKKEEENAVQMGVLLLGAVPRRLPAKEVSLKFRFAVRTRTWRAQDEV